MRHLFRKSSEPTANHQEVVADASSAVSNFHHLYYERPTQTWQDTYWLGVPTAKCPLDMWIYQEILTEVRPDLIVETGTYRGGSALFLAGICETLGRGRVTTIDIEPYEGRPQHPRIRYVSGSSTSEAVLDVVKREADRSDGVLVILDSDHSEAHVAAEIEVYAPMVSVGSYLVVEDTNVNGHPVLPEFGPGPMEAVEKFLAATDGFRRDPSCEKFMLTFNPGGFLKRVS